MTPRPVAVAALAVALAAVLPAPSALAAVPTMYSNCTNLQKSYPHGVGLRTARDKTSGTPVTTFRKDDAEYRRALSYNRGLDRDGDKIACEKR